MSQNIEINYLQDQEYISLFPFNGFTITKISYTGTGSSGNNMNVQFNKDKNINDIIPLLTCVTGAQGTGISVNTVIIAVGNLWGNNSQQGYSIPGQYSYNTNDRCFNKFYGVELAYAIGSNYFNLQWYLNIVPLSSEINFLLCNTVGQNHVLSMYFQN